MRAENLVLPGRGQLARDQHPRSAIVSPHARARPHRAKIETAVLLTPDFPGDKGGPLISCYGKRSYTPVHRNLRPVALLPRFLLHWPKHRQCPVHLLTCWPFDSSKVSPPSRLFLHSSSLLNPPPKPLLPEYLKIPEGEFPPGIPNKQKQQRPQSVISNLLSVIPRLFPDDPVFDASSTPISHVARNQSLTASITFLVRTPYKRTIH